MGGRKGGWASSPRMERFGACGLGLVLSLRCPAVCLSEVPTLLQC